MNYEERHNSIHSKTVTDLNIKLKLLDDSIEGNVSDVGFHSFLVLKVLAFELRTLLAREDAVPLELYPQPLIVSF
jgi:hypothetical protein